MKKVIIDGYTKKAYGLFNFKRGIGFKEINIETGTTSFVALIDIPITNQHQIKIFNNKIYYLMEDLNANAAKILLSQRIGGL